ncbi:MAG: LytR/AlgR family response regulator transcription factor [Salibacteraceae bacterium]
MILNCLIVDDEQPARDLLENYVARVPTLQLLGTCRNPMEALPILQQQRVDLLLLDIQMPELKGNDFLRTLHQRPSVVFTTAYPEYALEGYQLEVSDYLLKPFSFERFLQAINKVSREKGQRQHSSPPSTEVPATTTTEYLTVKADYKTHRLKLSDLVYIEGLREYVAFHSTAGRLVALESLRKLEESLPSDQFLRVHKSYIVNKHWVRSQSGNQLELEGKRVPIGKSYRSKVLKILFGE